MIKKTTNVSEIELKIGVTQQSLKELFSTVINEQLQRLNYCSFNKFAGSNNSMSDISNNLK